MTMKSKRSLDIVLREVEETGDRVKVTLAGERLRRSYTQLPNS